MTIARMNNATAPKTDKIMIIKVSIRKNLTSTRSISILSKNLSLCESIAAGAGRIFVVRVKKKV